MKIYFKHSNGWQLSIECQPMDPGKFYALAGLAAGALFVALIVGSIALS